MIGEYEALSNDGIPNQICFTRIGKQEAGSGWQTVNVSPTLAAATVNAFEGMQNGNVRYIRNGEFDAEDASLRIVTELRNDGRTMFLTRIKYGLTDEMDRPRPALFAQGFAFPVDLIASDPQSVLNVEYSNFAIAPDQTKTAPLVELTATAPTSFVLAPRRSAVELLASTGLDKQHFADLVLCTMITLFSRSKDTLTIHCDCSENTIRTVMSCLYAAVPPSLRSRLTFSTYLTNPGMPTTIVFAHPSRFSARVFDLATGKTNVLTPAARRRYGRYAFITHPATRFDDEYVGAYFSHLEDKVSHLDSLAAADMDMFQLAYDLMIDEQSGKTSHTYEECADRISSLLVLARLDRMNPYSERLIAETLGEFLSNGYPINDLLDEQLRIALGKARTAPLISMGERYFAKVVSDKTPEDGARYLNQTYPDRTSPTFLRLRALLADTESGQATLKQLYVNMLGTKIVADAVDGVIGPDQLEAYRDEAAVLSDQASVDRVVSEAAERYLCHTVQPDEDPAALVQRISAVWGQVLPGSRLKAVPPSIVSAFWKRFTFKTVSLDMRRYSWVSGDYPEYRVLEAAAECGTAFSQKNERALNQSLRRYSAAAAALDAAKRSTLDTFMLHTYENHRALYAEQTTDGRERGKGEVVSALELDVWILLGEVLLGSPEETAKYLVRQRMLPTADQERFFDMVDRSALLRQETWLTRFTEGFERYASGEPDRDLQQKAKDVLGDLNELGKIRAKAEKQRAKEEKQRAKEENRKKGGFFSRLNISLPFVGGHDIDDDDDDDESSFGEAPRAPRRAVGSSARAPKGGRR